MGRKGYSLEVKKLREQIITAFPDLSEMAEADRDHYARFRLIPAKLLVNVDWNYKQEDPETQAKLENNIKRTGQTENIHVRQRSDGKFDVGNGNHRNSIFQKQGVAYVLCYVHECSMAEFKRRVFETNETKFYPDEIAMMKLVKELSETFDLTDLKTSLPLRDFEIDAFVKYDEFTFSQYSMASGGGNGQNAGGKLEFALSEDTWKQWERWQEKSGKADPLDAFLTLLEAGLS